MLTAGLLSAIALAGLGGLRAPTATAFQAAEPASCNLSTSDIKALNFVVRQPVRLTVTRALLPGCDELASDARTATIAWGDGARSNATVTAGPTAANGDATIVVTGRHVYRRAPRANAQHICAYPIVVRITNQRTGRVIEDDHYQAVARRKGEVAPLCRG